MTDISLAAQHFEIAFAATRTRQRRTQALAVVAFALAALAAAQFSGFFDVNEMSLPSGERVAGWKLLIGLPRLGDYLAKTVPILHWRTLGADLGEWFWRWPTWAKLLGETILIAYMATLIGVVGGFLLSFLAARNLAPNRIAYHVARRFLEVVRTVPDLVWALIFVFSFGVGPLAGVLAIGLHTTGSLGKLYAEANENVDLRAAEAIRAVGGTWFDEIRYGVVPQVIPNVISYTLLRFEINVRSSSVIGYVGAGGLGQEIRTAISMQEYTDLSALFVIILVTVVVIDSASEKLRHRIIGLTGKGGLG
ncbi:phosphonate ABC transporter, permease protein PhnE [Chelatococcus asaccharovorans]|uniref:phosphonate ABC transporter, permease protein PhnE n=1 Tax=Chelatococcus asaccharovorans TaxID=28210 RepID=UPI00224C7622|nr:phosphonate ABC transporter, permease protein PhnE [Chelatococcus asaccharovorans]CAH1657742.1 Phosphonate transport system permease protein [Chelatococcus asaccharovorans]CAH1687488.1 Phosphonate transport system permease protein [Chelatococcus asaccharovorans]